MRVTLNRPERLNAMSLELLAEFDQVMDEFENDAGASALQYARRTALVPLELLSVHKAAVNRYLKVTGIRAAEQSACDLDAIAHQTGAVQNWVKLCRETGLREALEERDRPFKKPVNKPG